MNIGVIGVGRLGLMFALSFEKKGFNVFASSYKKSYVKNLQARQVESVEPGVKNLLKNAKNIKFTSNNHDVISQCDVIYVMVATPSLPTGDYDISAVWNVVKDFTDHTSSVSGKLLVIGCTTNPGTCVEIAKYLKPYGVDVAYHPTMAAQGSVLRDIENPPSLLFGVENNNVGQRCKEIFGKIVLGEVSFHVMSFSAAEIVKLAGNCKATTIISFYNFLGQMLIESGLEKDLQEAMTYTNTLKKDDFRTFGYGYGGPCFPRDNRSFVHYAQKIGMEYQIGEHIDQFNRAHADYLVKYLTNKNKRSLPYYFDYVSYKPGVSIFEESQQLLVCRKLLSMGYKVYVNPSIFLNNEIKQELQQDFYDLVEFVSFEDLYKQNINVLEANIQPWI